jgi:two-component system chemotaxis sensor kinase CheA
VRADDALPTFFAEAAELLRDMEAELLACAGGTATADDVNRIFRCAHTLKGSAGLFGLDAIVEFVHHVEAVLDQVRLGKVTLDAQLASVLLKCKDHIEGLLGCVHDGQISPDAAMLARGTELLDALGAPGTGSATKATAADKTSSAAAPQSAAAGAALWHVSLRFGPDVLTAGMDPLGFIRYLATFGTVRGMVVIDDALPDSEQLDPHKCYVGFEFAFETDADREKIVGAFEFVRDDSTVKLVPPGSPAPVYLETLRSAGLDDARAAQVLVQCGTLTAEALEAARQPVAGAQAQAAGAQAQPAGAQAQSAGTPAAKAAASQAPRGESSTIRIDAGKLDSLITRIGELITATASANLIARRSGSRDIEECMANIAGLVEEIREGSLQLRMVKIGGTFNRFRRVVHDVSRELGKEIELQISGEDTELDKTVVEKIADPLTHLVRNAIDHGIEPADVRVARGKRAAGCIRLNAYHDSGTIVIEVSDDGGGLKRERILAKAVERGLVDPSQKLTDSEIFNLIFEPGFSTAEKVTNLSGRGVGMDVVRRNITALRGTVSIKSAEGTGTTMTVRLPLTLAIINGFQIAIADSIFVLPLDSIEECIEYSSADGHDYTSLRGDVLPFIRLNDLFGITKPPARRQSIVVVRHAGQRAGIVVDALLGEFQTVIKPLGKIFSQVECVSGSSILGTGEVALILDVPAVVGRAVHRSNANNNHAAAAHVAAA